MEENNNQNTTEVEVDSINQNKLFSKLKQIRKKTLYIFLAILLVAFGISGAINIAQMEQTEKAQKTIESLEDDIAELNDKYETLVLENQELESEIQKYQDRSWSRCRECSTAKDCRWNDAYITGSKNTNEPCKGTVY